MLVDIHRIPVFLSTVVTHYEKSAPTVSAWADDLYIRLHENMGSVRLIEVWTAQCLYEGDNWEQANLAANRIFKLMNMLGQDTTGHLGF